ncbi:MAG: DUF418 domain-containing protein [Gaiellales bacterium]
MRGFALFGVLLAYTLWNLGGPPEETYSQADRILNSVLSALIDGKFYTLFACLFGLGFAIQLKRAADRGVSIVPVYCRRLLALLLIGLAHALLLRNGDILVPYAVLGFCLLPLRNVSNQSLLAVAVLSLLYPDVARGVWQLTGLPLPQRPAETAGLSYLAENYAWVRYWYASAVFSWPDALPLFLFGLYIGRRDVLENIAADRRGLWRALMAGLVIAALAYVGRDLLIKAWSNGPNTPYLFGERGALRFLWTVHAWGLAAFYASSLLLLCQRSAGRRWLAPLGAVGRMSLTNYLLQAVLVVPVCIAFDLFDRVTPSLGILLGLAVWSVQVPMSVWWLRHFRFGPAEWIWRSLTYGHPQPMRVADEPANEAVGP